MRAAYRHRQDALTERRALLEDRLRSVDAELTGVPSTRRLPGGLREDLQRLRRAATPEDDSVRSLVTAERAAERLEDSLEEALGLGAELGKSVEPLLPRRETIARWAKFAALASALLVVTVHQLGLDDFMLRAFGVHAQRASIEMTTSPPLRHALVDLGAAPGPSAAQDAPSAPPTVVPPEVELITSRWTRPEPRKKPLR